MESIVQTKNNDSLQLDGNITTRTNDEDQFAIVFRNLFDGRQDVVCLSSEMAEYVSTKAEIDTHFENHLAGKCRMGSYNLLPDGTVRWAMIEFEDHGGHKLEDPQKTSLQAIEHFTSQGISCYRELSKNPNGNCFHLWIFFEKPISAKKVHISLRSFVKDVLGIETEVFPKGYDTNGIGNQVWLPLFPASDYRGLGTPNNRTVFVDQNGDPFPDQPEFIKTIHRVPEGVFDHFITEYNLPIDEPSTTKTEKETFDADLIKVRTCSFMKYCEENAATLSEPLWYAWITNAIRCTGGREYIHEYGAKYPAYSRRETDKKIAHALRATGPMTHAAIEKLGFKCNCPERFKAPVSRSVILGCRGRSHSSGCTYQRPGKE